MPKIPRYADNNSSSPPLMRELIARDSGDVDVPLCNRIRSGRRAFRPGWEARRPSVAQFGDGKEVAAGNSAAAGQENHNAPVVQSSNDDTAISEEPRCALLCVAKKIVQRAADFGDTGA